MDTRRPVALATMTLLALAACGGGGKKTASLSSSKATTSTTAAGALPDAATPGAPPAGAGAAAPSGGQIPQTATGGGATAAPTAKGTGGTATTAKAGGSTAGTTPARAPAPGAKASSGSTAPGTYTAHVTGTSSFSTKPVDGDATDVFDPPNNGTQHNRSTFGGGTTDQVMRLTGEGSFLTELHTANQGLMEDFAFNPPVLAYPNPASVGKEWSWSATSSQGLMVTASFKVARTETLTIGTEQVPTTVVESQVDTKGDLNSTTKSTLWVSEVHRLVVQHHDVVNGNYKAAFTFTSDTTSTLRSTTPS